MKSAAALILSLLGLCTLTGCGAQVQNAINAQKAQADLGQAQQAAQNGDAAQARLWADRAIAVDPGALGTYLTTADTPPGGLTIESVFADAGDQADLRDYLKRAAARHPDDYRPRTELAGVYGTLGDTADQRAAAASAAALLEKQVAAPHDAAATQALSVALAQAYCDAGQTAKGVAAFQAIVQAHPADSASPNELAYAVAVADDKPDLPLARRMAQKALQNAARDGSSEQGVAAIQDTLGWVQYRQGGPQDLQDALANLQSAVSADPREPVERYHLGMVYAALGQPDAARAELGHAVRLAQGYADAQRALSRLDEQHPARTAAGP